MHMIGRLQAEPSHAAADPQGVIVVVDLLHPVHDVGSDLRGRVVGIHVFSSLGVLGFPVQEILLEPFMGKMDPVFHPLHPVLIFFKGILGPVALDLGDALLLVGGEHEEVEGIQHAQLDIHLLFPFGDVMRVVLRINADLFSRGLGSQGKYFANPRFINNNL